MIDTFSEGFPAGKAGERTEEIGFTQVRIVSDLHKNRKQVDCLDDSVCTIRKKKES